MKYGVIIKMTEAYREAHPSISARGWAELYLGQPVPEGVQISTHVDWHTENWEIKLRSDEFHLGLFQIPEAAEYPHRAHRHPVFDDE